VVSGGIGEVPGAAISFGRHKKRTGGDAMYQMSGPEMLTQLKVNDMLRDAERIHRVNDVLKERKAARHALFSLNLSRFWRRQAVARPALQPPGY
jgi:hypothetical protein